MAIQPQLFSAQDYWEAGKTPAPWVRIPGSAEEEQDTLKMLDSIRNAAWKVVDVETSGLTPGSVPVKVAPKVNKSGGDPTLRVRVASVLWPEGERIRYESFDLDPFRAKGEEWVTRICDAALSNVFIAHNAGFDTYWLRQHSRVKPTRVLDTMLIARILDPKLPRKLMAIASRYLDEPNNPVVKALLKTVQGEKSGWALADVAAVLLGVVMPKELQKPQNWIGYSLSEQHYEYAVDDVLRTYQILAVLLGLHPEGDSSLPGVLPILSAYDSACQQHPEMLQQEAQVWDLIPIRERGMPIDFVQTKRFVADKQQEMAEQARRMVEIEPDLALFEKDLADWGKGISAALKNALGRSFLKRGLEVQVTDKKGDYKIGEKDLRLIGAQEPGEAAELYESWIALNKAKKVGSMAEDVADFARRSEDLRVHPLLSHGPSTGRLSCAEPNAQQFPALADFRAIVRGGLEGGKPSAHPTKICAVDYSALDMRVGAALAIRAQREIALAAESGEYNGRPVDPVVLAIIERIYGMFPRGEAVKPGAKDGPWNFEGASKSPLLPLTNYLGKVKERWQDLETQMRTHMGRKDAISADERNQFWETYRTLKKRITLGNFAYRLAEVSIRALESSEPDWSALRDTFRLKIDIHTSTALRMQNQDPKVLFSGLSEEELEKKQKAVKHDLGDKRKGGKVANLGLLYYMQAQGFKDYAAKSFNIHWTLDETAVIRHTWLDSHPEIDLWALWTMLNPVELVQVPDLSRRSGFRYEEMYRSVTLGGRVMYPLGLNAGLAYGDQGTGADILGHVVHTLATDYPELSRCAINQVHDEMVFELPADRAEEYTDRLGRIMDDCANQFLMPYGVPSACTPALGDVWLKD